jgi:hypothetical protein
VTRLVGYSEYREALARLDALVALATDEELRVMDALVAARDEYTVYTNLSRRLEGERGPTPLSEAGGGPMRGLGWVLGTARIELAAMAAVYAQADDPFALLPPTRIELPMYGELLLDGARMHYLALQNDPAAHRYAEYRTAQVSWDNVERGRPEIDPAHALAYGRRVLLTQAFLAAVEEHLGQQFAEAQRAELTSWQSHAEELQQTLLYKVLCQKRVERDIVTETTRTWDTLGGARSCYLRFAGQEVQAGRAQEGTKRQRESTEVFSSGRTLAPGVAKPTLAPE